MPPSLILSSAMAKSVAVGQRDLPTARLAGRWAVDRDQPCAGRAIAAAGRRSGRSAPAQPRPRPAPAGAAERPALAAHRLPQRRVQLGARSSLPVAPVELVVAVAEPQTKLLLGLRLSLTRKQAAVDRDLAEGRDHVALPRRLDHRRRDRLRE